MSGRSRYRRRPRGSGGHQNAKGQFGAKPMDAKRLFGGAVAAGAATYVRSRDLPRLLALWPRELEDESEAGRALVLAKLRRALRTERRRARAAHWSYDLNKHLGLLSAYKAELAGLRSRNALLGKRRLRTGR